MLATAAIVIVTVAIVWGLIGWWRAMRRGENAQTAANESAHAVVDLLHKMVHDVSEYGWRQRIEDLQSEQTATFREIRDALEAIRDALEHNGNDTDS